MVFYICPNTATSLQISQAMTLITQLSSRCGTSCRLSEKHRNVFSNMPGTEFSDSPVGCKYVVAIGGDGAVLRAAQLAVKFDIPLVGINGGHLGYLTAFEFSSVTKLTGESFDRLTATKRSLLSFKYDGCEQLALNDVVIGKHNTGRTTKLEVSCGGTKLIGWRCDGIIISTPTGSTAYNLSAGGPLLSPTLDAVIITPVCAHAVLSRSIVINNAEPITITVIDKEDDLALISSDGVLLGEIKDSITIEKYSRALTLLTDGNDGFLSTVYNISSQR